MIHLVGLSGSLRKGAYNTFLLHAAKELLPEGMDMNIVSFADLPVYNGDDDLPIRAERPEPVRRFRDQLEGMDGLVIATPEYNHAIPGGLKNAIDWASRGTDAPLLHKPVAVMGATTGLWGTIRGQYNFHPIFQALNMHPVYKPEVFVARAADKFDAEGRLTDEVTRKMMLQQLEALKQLIVQLQQP